LKATVSFDYGKHAAAQAEAWRERTKSGQNVAPIPSISPEDMAEREACRTDFERFCKTYFPHAFRLSFSPDHLRVISKIEGAVLRGMLAAFAMPRGYGKTVLSKAAALWAILYGHRRWVVMIGATGPLGIKLLKDGIKPMVRGNYRLAKAFPEVCKPVRLANGSALKATGLHYNDSPCFMVWEKDTIVFPRVPLDTCLCAEARITCFGIEGAIRGQVATLSTGEEVRPDFVLVDDPQTKASARSLSQTQERYEIIMGDVLGLAGGDVSIAGLVPCTVIQKNDLSERLLDHKLTPEMRGERTKLVYEFPTDDSLWEKYFITRENDLHNGGDGTVATRLYIANQAAMDAGARIAWPDRFPKEFASAIEHAMYLRYRSPGVFAAEYQNEPAEQSGEEYKFPSAREIIGKTSGLERGLVPHWATYLCGFVDVQQNALYWCVCAWDDQFTGQVVDYGCFPKQHQSYFDYRNLRYTLGQRLKGEGAEAAIYKGLSDLSEELCSREWRRDDGATIRIGKLLVDSGNFTETVYGFCRNSIFASVVSPSKGRGVKAGNIPWERFKQAPGERIGTNWIERTVIAKRRVRLLEFDANAWKTFAQLRLASPFGSPGCLSLFKASPYDHRLFADHITAEKPVKTEGHGRTVYEWSLPPDRPDNHLFDCLVGCCVGASMLGAALKEQGAKPAKRKRTLQEMQEAARK
jgi:hypothetical protein